MECFEYRCNFLIDVFSSSLEICGASWNFQSQEKWLKKPEAFHNTGESKTFQSIRFFCTSVGWLIWGLMFTTRVLVGQRGWKEPNTYFSAFFTTLDSSLEVEAAFTSLFLFSSPLSHVLLWERSIPPARFALLPLLETKMTQEKHVPYFIGKESNSREADKQVQGRS